MRLCAAGSGRPWAKVVEAPGMVAQSGLTLLGLKPGCLFSITRREAGLAVGAVDRDEGRVLEIGVGGVVAGEVAYAVAAADDGQRVGGVGEADAGRGVGVVGRDAGVAIDAVDVGYLEGGCDGCGARAQGLAVVEVRDAVMRLGEGGEDVVANTVEQGQLGIELPAVLDEEAGLVAAVVGRVEVVVTGAGAEGANEARSELVILRLLLTGGWGTGEGSVVGLKTEGYWPAAKALWTLRACRRIKLAPILMLWLPLV